MVDTLRGYWLLENKVLLEVYEEEKRKFSKGTEVEGLIRILDSIVRIGSNIRTNKDLFH